MGNDGATTETVGGGEHPYSPQCGQASSAGDLLGTGGAPACGDGPSLAGCGACFGRRLHGHSPVVCGLVGVVVLTKDATIGCLSSA